MSFTNSFRMERVYFERLKSMIDILKPYLNTETDEKLKSILENSIDDNGAILLLYRNLGECWAELSDLIKKADEKIDSLDDKSEKYHDELNKRIDEVNNYIMGILREIEARLETVEQDLATLSRNIILDLERVNDEYTLSYKGDPVDFAQLAEWVSFPDNVIIRGVVNGEETEFQLREFDTDETSGSFEFYSTGLDNNVVKEITVTVLSDDSVTVATVTQTVKEYTAGNGINISSDDEISVDFDVVQEKLTAGTGISIDPDTKEITNTSPGVDLWAQKAGGNHANIFNNIYANNPNIASGVGSHSEGGINVVGSSNQLRPNKATGISSHAEGLNNKASGKASHVEGDSNKAENEGSHAEGVATTASGVRSHSEGSTSTASGTGSHAEGSGTTASGDGSHSEGSTTTASGGNAHAEGAGSKAVGGNSHAEGSYSEANGDKSHAEGDHTIANGENQHVSGAWNVANNSSLEIIGNGTQALRSNARTLDGSGNEWLAGEIRPEIGLRLKAPNNTYYLVTVDNNGALVVTAI